MISLTNTRCEWYNDSQWITNINITYVVTTLWMPAQHSVANSITANCCRVRWLTQWFKLLSRTSQHEQRPWNYTNLNHSYNRIPSQHFFTSKMITAISHNSIPQDTVISSTRSSFYTVAKHVACKEKINNTKTKLYLCNYQISRLKLMYKT